MPSFRGKVTRSSLSGGKSWLLLMPDGSSYELSGAGIAILDDGSFIEAIGSIDRKAVSITQSGPILKMDRCTVLSGPDKKASPSNTVVDKNGIAQVNNDSQDIVY